MRISDLDIAHRFYQRATLLGQRGLRLGKQLRADAPPAMILVHNEDGDPADRPMLQGGNHRPADTADHASKFGGDMDPRTLLAQRGDNTRDIIIARVNAAKLTKEFHYGAGIGGLCGT